MRVPSSRSIFLGLVIALLGLALASCVNRRGGGGDGEYEGDEPGECSDDADNDADGLFDCDDPGCAGAAACGGVDDDDSAAADDDDDTLPDDDDTLPDDDDTTPPPDDDDTVADDDDTTPPPDDDDTVVDDDDTTPDPPPTGTAVVLGPLECGDVILGDTGVDGTTEIDQYSCSTWWEQGPEMAWSFTPTEPVELYLYLTCLGPHELDLFLIEDQGNGAFQDDCVASGGYYIQEDVFPTSTWYVVVDGFSGWYGPFELEVTCTPLEED